MQTFDVDCYDLNFLIIYANNPIFINFMQKINFNEFELKQIQENIF